MHGAAACGIQHHCCRAEGAVRGPDVEVKATWCPFPFHRTAGGWPAGRHAPMGEAQGSASLAKDSEQGPSAGTACRLHFTVQLLRVLPGCSRSGFIFMLSWSPAHHSRALLFTAQNTQQFLFKNLSHTYLAQIKSD